MKIIPGVNADTTDLLRSIVSMNVSIMCRVFPPLTSAVDVTGAAYRYASAPGTAVQALRETGVYKQCTDVISSYSPAALLFRESGDKKRQEAWRLASPDFDLLYENQHYEERRYRKLKWVCTQMTHFSRNEATREGEYRLHKYVHGLNDKKIDMEMTVPMVVMVDSTSSTNYESTFTISMCLPQEHRRKPPTPLMPGVCIRDNAVLNVYVRSFDGLVDDERWIKEAAMLVASLNSDGRTDYERDKFCIVTYDSKYKLEDRHNEIWCFKSKS